MRIRRTWVQFIRNPNKLGAVVNLMTKMTVISETLEVEQIQHIDLECYAMLFWVLNRNEIFAYEKNQYFV